jgi:hypothetical protein
LILDHDYWVNIYGNFNHLLTTVPHEFFHEIQFGRNNGPPIEGNLWYFEGSAVWMQAEVFQTIKSYIQEYLSGSSSCSNLFYCTSLSLTYESDQIIRQYGDVIFFKYLTEYKQKTNAVKDIQDLAVTTQSGIEALRQYVANTMGTTMPEMMLDFGMSLIQCTGYRDGSLYHPEVGYNLLNVVFDGVISTPTYIGHYSYYTNQFTTDQGTSSLKVSAFPTGNVRIGVLKCTGNRTGCSSVSLNSTITGFGSTYPYVYVIVANGDSTIDYPTYLFSLDIEPMPTTRSVTLYNKKWNLMYLPVDPVSNITGDVFSQQNVQLVLAYPHTFLDNRAASQSYLGLGSPIWAYPDFDSGAVSVITSSTTYTALTRTIHQNQWEFIGTPDLTNTTPYDSSNVTITIGSNTYTLEQALSNNFISTLYYYDPSTNSYKTVAPTRGSLSPWRAYLFKSYIDGSISITK